MAAAPRARPQDFFTDAQWQHLTARSSWRGLWLVAHCWGVIALAIAMGVRWPVTIPLAVLIVGARQLGLFILMHDAAHAVLHRDRRINDAVGEWLCSPTITAYRPYHLQHHRFVQQTEDPDLVLSAPFPITRASLWRKVARDLTGQTFWKQRFGHYGDALRARPAGTPWAPVLRAELRKDRRFLIANGLGFAAFAIAGLGWAWALMWLLPMATWLPLVSRVRNIAEHALIAQNEADPLRQARTTHAGFVERALVAPYWVNHHCEHHMFTAIPCWNLPKAHRLLHEGGVLPRMATEPGYAALLRRVAPA